MTLDEILAGLESLKDFVNDHQKPSIDHLKAAVSELVAQRHPREEASAEVVESQQDTPREESKEEFVPLNTPKEKVHKRPYKRRK